MKRYVLGVDQGGTKTNALVADLNGEILGFGAAGGACHTITGLEHAMGCLRGAFEEALTQAGVTYDDILCVAGGITGIDYDYEEELLTREIGALTGVSDVRLYNDCIGALWGGTFEIPAAVCCAGTGLNVGGVDAQGRSMHLGNYCHGDHQGGGALGRHALKAVFDAHIGKAPATRLTNKLLAYYDLPDVDALLFKNCRKKEIRTSELPPLLFEAAGEGDEVAVEIIADLGRNLAQYVTAAIHMMGLPAGAAIPVVISGGIFKGRPPILQQAMEAELHRHNPNAFLRQARFEPVVGGAVTALHAHGAPGWEARIAQSAAASKLERQ